MTISTATRKLLWGRSGGRCARCKIELTEDRDGCVLEIVIGDECHIAPQSPRGPRGTCNGDPGSDGEGNLLVLCPSCHRVVDAHPTFYDSEHLEVLKREHESWVRAQLSATPAEGNGTGTHDAASFDEDVLRHYYQCFDRFAFRVPMRHEEPAALIQAIRDTRVALTTGVVRLSDGTIVYRTMGKARVRSHEYRVALDQIVCLLRGIEIRWDQAILGDELEQRGNGRISYSEPFLQDMDDLRNQVVRLANSLFTRVGLKEFPEIPRLGPEDRGAGYTTGRLGVEREVHTPWGNRTPLDGIIGLLSSAWTHSKDGDPKDR